MFLLTAQHEQSGIHLCCSRSMMFAYVVNQTQNKTKNQNNMFAHVIM